ncbi:cold shock domain-containing protein [Photobacterium japonica]|uniref:cold-shock protein n=1 Tax=Photobacterium japonica TaxID=2910235 RepID=UPI003D118029
MRGNITSFLPEKMYGFIKGDDGKDYFFHANEFIQHDHLDKLSDDAFVEFDQQATPKGYKAKRCRLLNPVEILTYIEPDHCLTSSTPTIHGWEVIEHGEWFVHGSSSDSADDAKKDVILSAELLGANAIVDLEYYKTTGSRLGQRKGTYYYTVHNFRGRVMTVAKRHSQGTYRSDDLLGLNQRADAVKVAMSEKTAKSKKKRNSVWLVVLALLGGCWLSLPFLYTCLFIPAFVTVLFVFGYADDHDAWLEPDASFTP